MTKVELPPHVKAVIFDFDGTIVDSVDIHFECWMQNVTNFGLEANADELYPLFGYSSDQVAESVIKKFNLNLKPEELSEAKDKIYLTNLDKVRIYPNTLNLIKNYHAHYKLAIGTNEVSKIFGQIIDFFNIKHYFGAVVSLSENLKPKPAPDIYLECARLLGVEPQYCHVFEDSKFGIEAAKIAGMTYTRVYKNEFFNE